MANNCYYEMRVRGKDRHRLYDILNYEDEQYYLARIFSVTIFNESEDTLYIAGDCAWSVYSCMCGEDEGAYYKTNEEKRDEKGRLLVNIAYLTKRLDIEVEIISDEPGIAFSEHYYYNNGKEIVNDCFDYPSEEEMYPNIEDIDAYLEETGEYYTGIDNLVFFDHID